MEKKSRVLSAQLTFTVGRVKGQWAEFGSGFGFGFIYAIQEYIHEGDLTSASWHISTRLLSGTTVCL